MHASQDGSAGEAQHHLPILGLSPNARARELCQITPKDPRAARGLVEAVLAAPSLSLPGAPVGRALTIDVDADATAFCPCSPQLRLHCASLMLPTRIPNPNRNCRRTMNELLLEKNGISYRANAYLPNRPTILFIHGLTGSASAWFEYERLFEEDFNLINVDLRGHGNSTKPIEYHAYSIDAQTDAIAPALAHVDVESLFVVSHSFGTLIALRMILKHLKNARGLILLSPTYAVEKGVRAFIIRLLVSMVATAMRAFPFSPAVRGRTDYSKHRNSGDWNLARMLDDIRNTSLRVYFFCLAHIYRFKQGREWEQLSMPVIILHGKLDSLIPVRNAARLHQVLPNSQLFIIDTGNHIMVLNNVKEIVKAIENIATPL